MRLRTWLILAAVLAIVQGVLCGLSILQTNAVLSDLLKRRLVVIVHSAASAFQPVINLGLPIAMLRNGDAILARAKGFDENIIAVHAFNTSGVIAHSTATKRPNFVGSDVLRQMQLSDSPTWDGETATELFVGRTLRGRDGATVGGIVLSYPKRKMDATSASALHVIVRSAALIWVAMVTAAAILLGFLLAGPARAMTRLRSLARGAAKSIQPDVQPQNNGTKANDPFAEAVVRLESNLTLAEKKYGEVEALLAAESGRLAIDEQQPVAPVPDHADVADPGSPPTVTPDPSRSLARVIAGRLMPLAAVLIVASAGLNGWIVLRTVNKLIEPELAARTNLIGAVVSENVQRAVSAGAPLDELVGAEKYFGDMLPWFPEVAYVAVATGRIILEAGTRLDPYLAPPRERKDVRSHPIVHDGKEIAYVVIDVDPDFISKRFRDVFLDMGVVLLITLIVAFEIMVLLTSRTLTARLDRLQRLAAMQAAGNFSRFAATQARGPIAQLAGVLSNRAVALHSAVSHLESHATSKASREAIIKIRNKFGLTEAQPLPLRVSYFTDVRVALFLFAVADQLPLAFLPLYTRSFAETVPWLDVSLLLSLPLAGYIFGIILGSPLSRGLAERFGVRALFVATSVPLIAAYVGLHYATSALEIVALRAITGFGYAIITLACQDYVLDTAPTGQRDRALGSFTLVLFGGIFSGAALGGVLADRLGQANVFLLSAGLIFVSAVLSLWLLGGGYGRRDGTGQASIAAMWSAASHKRFLAILLGLALPANLTLQGFVSYVVALEVDAIGGSRADIGRTMVLYFCGIMLVSGLAGRISSLAIPVWRIASFGALIAGLALATFAIYPTGASMVFAVVVAGLGHGVVRYAQVSLAMDLAEGELADIGANAVLGALRTLERLTSVIGLLLVAWLSGAAGYGAGAGAIAVLALAGAVLFARLYGKGESPRTGAPDGSIPSE